MQRLPESLARELGSSEQAEPHVVHFAEGLLGLPTIRDYLVVRSAELDPFLLLRAAPNGPTQFLVLDPYSTDPDYRVVISDATRQELGLEGPQELLVLVVAQLSHDPAECAANLRAPILINPATMTGKQIILEDDSYPIRAPLYGRSLAAEEAPC